jgi:CheY-like chemotaxis protein
MAFLMPGEAALNSVLIVDDDPIFVELARSMLAVRGARSIETASTAADAFEAIGSGLVCPDLIVCDLNMPSFDGIEFLGQLQNTSCKSRILIASGAHESVIRAAVVLGRTYGLDMLGAVAKPLTPGKLDACLAAAAFGSIVDFTPVRCSA